MKNREKKIQPDIAPEEVTQISQFSTELITENEKTSSPSGKPEEEKPVSIVSIYQEGKKRGEKLKAHMYSREIARQQHRPVSLSGNLFSCLTDNARKHAIELQEKGSLLSSLVDGIDGGVLSTKVIIALIQVLNEQSNLSNPEEVQRASNKIAGLFGYEAKGARTAGAITKNDHHDKEGYAVSLMPWVIINIADFTRRVLSIPESQKVGKKEKDSIKDTLDELRNKKLFYKCANGHYRSITLIRGSNEDIDPKTKAEMRIIELDGVFLKNIQHDFLPLPPDILIRLKGRQSTLTMRLFWFLVEQCSYKKPTYPEERKFKSELYDEVAIIDRYKDHPSDRDKDFKKAIAKMKEIRLISDYTECGDRETGEITCVFTFREDFLKVL